ncbi:MAG: hypothetical protein A2069_07055 [Planctomycetes bacterium GWB2_41_19]|nr:MAG: hypothetical protein A2069_07055 [Planctomycetes bacterium GWB2_41_19]
MYKRTAKTKCFMAFLLFFPFLILSSLQQEAFSKTHDESLGKIQWHAIRNANSNEKYATAGDIVLMGAFATSDEPVSLPISLEFEFSTYKEFYMGIVIINDSGDDKDITVRFELTGPRGGKEEEDITVPANFTYIAYIKDIFGRPDIYTFKGSIKDVGSSKIKMLFTE